MSYFITATRPSEGHRRYFWNGSGFSPNRKSAVLYPTLADAAIGAERMREHSRRLNLMMISVRPTKRNDWMRPLARAKHN